jgi:hypothetical protein
MKKRGRGACLTLLALAVAQFGTGGDRALLSTVQGTYASSEFPGMRLRLDGQGIATLEEGWLLPQKVVLRRGRIGMRLPRLIPPAQASGLVVEEGSVGRGGVMQWPRPRLRSSDAWPPSLEDPTAPVVWPWPKADEREDADDSVWLTPVAWPPRLYLVRDLEGFCGAVAAGREPRNVAEGKEFLRLGDHLKRVREPRPRQCGRRP